MTQSPDYDVLLEEANRARMALNATPWWRPIKRQKAAERYKLALLRVLPPERSEP